MPLKTFSSILGFQTHVLQIYLIKSYIYYYIILYNIILYIIPPLYYISQCAAVSLFSTNTYTYNTTNIYTNLMCIHNIRHIYNIQSYYFQTQSSCVVTNNECNPIYEFNNLLVNIGGKEVFFSCPVYKTILFCEVFIGL